MGNEGLGIQGFYSEFMLNLDLYQKMSLTMRVMRGITLSLFVRVIQIDGGTFLY